MSTVIGGLRSELAFATRPYRQSAGDHLNQNLHHPVGQHPSISRYWIFRIGWLVGRVRIANFLSEMLVGLYAAALVQHGELRRASGPVMKLPELFQAGQYRWDYLYLGADLDRKIRERVSLGPLRRRASA